jgi:hypothetical protein
MSAVCCLSTCSAPHRNNSRVLLPHALHCALQLPPSPACEVVFSTAWWEVVQDLRARDLLSDAEVGSLTYQHLAWAPGRQHAWLLPPR